MPNVATIADVARAAGVSITTVSRVLSPGAVPHPVRADTAERVRAAARELKFTPSPLARGLASRHSGLIGLIVPDLADPHYPQIAAGVEDRARDGRLDVLICNTLGDVGRLTAYLRLLQARRVDAIVLSGGTSLSAEALQALEDIDVPLVLIGRPTTGVPWPYVSIDNADGARQATRHLLDLGRRRVLHLGGPVTQTTMADRAAGYTAAMRAAGLAPEILASNGTPEDGYTRLERRLEGDGQVVPEAIFAATDRLAIAAMALAADRHLHVPDDLAVVGFDDIPLAGQLRPALSTLAQPAHELGTVAIDLAQRRIADESVEPVTLSARLVPRASSLGPGGRYVS
jgi:LacI family transcriptional regulator